MITPRIVFIRCLLSRIQWRGHASRSQGTLHLNLQAALRTCEPVVNNVVDTLMICCPISADKICLPLACDHESGRKMKPVTNDQTSGKADIRDDGRRAKASKWSEADRSR